MAGNDRRNTGSVLDFVYWVQKQIGDGYVATVTVDLANPDPSVFNLAQLVRWAANQVGVFMPATADEQIAYAESSGRLIPVDTALNTRGAIVWRPGFVAISLGLSRTIQGVTGKIGLVMNTDPTMYQKAAKIPGIRY